MLKKRVIVLINTDSVYWLRTERIWFWKSKKSYLNNLIFQLIKEDGKQKFTNIQMY